MKFYTLCFLSSILSVKNVILATKEESVKIVNILKELDWKPSVILTSNFELGKELSRKFYKETYQVISSPNSIHQILHQKTFHDMVLFDTHQNTDAK